MKRFGCVRKPRFARASNGRKSRLERTVETMMTLQAKLVIGAEIKVRVVWCLLALLALELLDGSDGDVMVVDGLAELLHLGVVRTNDSCMDRRDRKSVV